MPLAGQARTPVTTALSFAETQLWREARGGPDTPPFIDCAPSLSLVVRLRNALDVEALRASLDEIVRRHDVLRSRFVGDAEGRPIRLGQSTTPVGLTAIDGRDAAAAAPVAPAAGSATGPLPEAVRDRLAWQASQPFDLARGPLLRASLIALADDDHALAITVHHIVFDRWSRRVLARELERQYDAYMTGAPARLPPLDASYADYVQWQRDRVEGPLGRELAGYWADRLRGLGDLDLPADRARDAITSTRAAICHFTIPEDDAARLAAASRRGRTTLAAFMLAILMLWLSRLSGEDDIAVGVPLSDRRRPEFEPLIGLFMNVVVVRVAVTRDLTFLDLLDRVRRTLVDACRCQDLPYGHLVDLLGARPPLYRVVFNFMPAIPASDVALSGLEVTPLSVATERSSLADLSLHIRQQPGALSCRLAYKTQQFSTERVAGFAAQFQALTAAVLDSPGRPVRDVPLVT